MHLLYDCYTTIKSQRKRQPTTGSSDTTIVPHWGERVFTLQAFTLNYGLPRESRMLGGEVTLQMRHLPQSGLTSEECLLPALPGNKLIRIHSQSGGIWATHHNICYTFVPGSPHELFQSIIEWKTKKQKQCIKKIPQYSGNVVCSSWKTFPSEKKNLTTEF